MMIKPIFQEGDNKKLTLTKLGWPSLIVHKGNMAQWRPIGDLHDSVI